MESSLGLMIRPTSNLSSANSLIYTLVNVVLPHPISPESMAPPFPVLPGVEPRPSDLEPLLDWRRSQGYNVILATTTQTGTTTRVNTDSSGNEATGGPSNRPALSADGRYVAFHSIATNLVAGDTNATWDVFVHDRQTGITERLSVDSSGSQGNACSMRPAISGDGRYVAFLSDATNLVPDDTMYFFGDPGPA